MNYTEEQFSKLPKWAQNEITRLDRNYAQLKSKANQMAGEEETNVFIGNYENDIPLPKNSRIKFILPDGYIDVIINNSFLEVRSMSEKDFAIAPSVSNSVRVCLVDIK